MKDFSDKFDDNLVNSQIQSEKLEIKQRMHIRNEDKVLLDQKRERNESSSKNI